MLENVIFLDRDGVINRDSPQFIKGIWEFEFLPRSLEAIRLLTDGGFPLFLVTNQSGIGRGIISPRALNAIHEYLIATAAANGGRICDVFHCPHVPEDDCDCRKPRPGLIHQARDRYDIDLSSAVMIGDSARDIECGRRAGCGRTVLVRTGNGDLAATALLETKTPVDHWAVDLFDAARYLLSTRCPTPASGRLSR